MSLIFDAHAHYDDEAFNDDRDILLSSMKENGVGIIVNAAVDIASSYVGLQLAEQYVFMYTTAGIHPDGAADVSADYIDETARLLENKKAVAIGEIGLDYHWDTTNKAIQMKVFTEQLALAKELDVPVVIHDREAHGDVLDILKKYRPKGLVHCFSGSVEMAREIIRLGMSISLGGVVTFKNAKNAVKVAAEIPLDRLLLETDAPYLAPVPFRGKRCDSTMIKHTAMHIGEIRNISAQTVIDTAFENGVRLYGMEI